MEGKKWQSLSKDKICEMWHNAKSKKILQDIQVFSLDSSDTGVYKIEGKMCLISVVCVCLCGRASHGVRALTYVHVCVRAC